MADDDRVVPPEATRDVAARDGAADGGAPRTRPDAERETGDPGWRAARRLLRGPLRVLVAGQCLGQLGDGLAQIAFAQFVVFDAGKGATPARIAALLAVTLLPFSLVGPFAGVLIDRWSRRRVLVVMSLARSALTLAAVTTVATRSSAGAFAGVLVLLGTSRFVLAAKGAALPRTVRPHELVTASALSAVAGMSASFIGAVGGAGFVGRSAGAGFASAAALYVAAAAVFTRLPDVGGGGQSDIIRRVRQAVGEVRAGARAITGDPAVWQPLATVWLHRLLLGAGFVLLVLVSDSRFHLRIAGYGLALAVTGVAAFAGSLVAPVCARRWSPKALLPVTFLPPAVAAYAAGIAPNLVVLVAAIGVTALSFQLLKVLVDALVGRATPDQVRGRVFAVYDVLYNVAFVAAGLLIIPLWDPTGVRRLLWWLAVAFALGWLGCARMSGGWPFAARPTRTASTDRVSASRQPAGRAGRWPGRFVTLLCGALPVLALPAVAWWWFAWVALVPLLVALRAAGSGREAAVRGWWGGAGFIAATWYWLAPNAGPMLAILAFGLGALWAPWGWAVRRLLGGRPGMRCAMASLVVLPAGWVAIEAVRSWQFLGGPWALLGTSQWNQPASLASASLGGVWLTGFLVVLVNVALVAASVTGRPRARAGVAAAALAAVAVGPVWGALRPALAASGHIRVAVVQPGVLPTPAARLDREIRLTDAVAARRPSLVVWGESSVGYDLFADRVVARRILALSRRTGLDLLVNVDGRQGGGRRVYKTSVLVTPSGVAARYDKTRLVPFGEYVPLRPALGWLSHVTKAAGVNRGRGDGPVVMTADGARIGPLVCFESTFPDMARREVRLGARLIVYQTSSSTFQGSWAQPQHAAVAAVRAVETGRPVVHAALTGTSAAFDATGHRLLWLPAGRVGVAVVDMTTVAARTPYDVVGDWVLIVAAGIIAAALAGAAMSAASPRATIPTPTGGRTPTGSARAGSTAATSAAPPTRVSRPS